MFAKQISRIVIVVIATVIVFSTVGFTASPISAQRHMVNIVVSAAQYAHANCVVRPLDTTDYFFRHSELRAMRSADTTDYFFRHRELSTTPSVDITDYYFRHPAC